MSELALRQTPLRKVRDELSYDVDVLLHWVIGRDMPNTPFSEVLEYVDRARDTRRDLNKATGSAVLRAGQVFFNQRAVFAHDGRGSLAAYIPAADTVSSGRRPPLSYLERGFKRRSMPHRWAFIGAVLLDDDYADDKATMARVVDAAVADAHPDQQAVIYPYGHETVLKDVLDGLGFKKQSAADSPFTGVVEERWTHESVGQMQSSAKTLLDVLAISPDLDS